MAKIVNDPSMKTVEKQSVTFIDITDAEIRAGDHVQKQLDEQAAEYPGTNQELRQKLLELKN